MRVMSVEELFERIRMLSYRLLNSVHYLSSESVRAILEEIANLYEEYISKLPPEYRDADFTVMTPNGMFRVSRRWIPNILRRASTLTPDIKAILESFL